MVADKIYNVPNTLLEAAIREVEALDWSKAGPGGKKFPAVRTFNLLAPVEVPETRELIEWVKKVTNAMSTGLLLLTRLPSGEMIDSHINNDDYSKMFGRYHIPLVSHPDVRVTNTGTGEEQHMEVGALYRLNRVEHSIMNLSEVDRIHLIIDVQSAEV